MSELRTNHPVADGFDSREPCEECGHTAKYHEGPDDSEPCCYFKSTSGKYQCRCGGWPVPPVSTKVEEAKAYLTALDLSSKEQGELSGWLMGENMRSLFDKIGQMINNEGAPD